MMDRINADLKEAMKAQDRNRLECLRMMKAKVLAVDARASMPDAEVEKIFRTYVKSLQETVDVLSKNNRPDELEATKKEIVIVEAYLPKQLGEAETKALVDQVIAETGVKLKSDMGKVMKGVMAKGLAVDGKFVNQYAVTKLG